MAARITKFYAEALRSNVNGLGSIFTVSATTSFTVGTSASFIDVRIITVGATTSFTLRSIAYIPVSISVAASSAMVFTVTTTENIPVSHELSASTEFFIGGSGNGYNTKIMVSASTSFSFVSRKMVTTTFCFGPKFVSAVTSIILSDANSVLRNTSWLVEATSSMSLSNKASFIRNAALYVSATSSVGLSSLGSEVGVFGISAATSVSLSATVTQCRDIYASATTSLGMGIGDGAGNNFKRVIGETSILLVTTAGIVSLGGTEARTDFTITTLASAKLQLPWRPAPLTLPPGGNLPHS